MPKERLHGCFFYAQKSSWRLNCPIDYPCEMGYKLSPAVEAPRLKTVPKEEIWNF